MQGACQGIGWHRICYAKTRGRSYEKGGLARFVHGIKGRGGSGTEFASKNDLGNSMGADMVARILLGVGV